MADITDAAIGSPHWGACETCLNFDEYNGCNVKEEIQLSLYLGDFILCDDYEVRQG